jgi:IS5 family transposase
MRPKKSPQDQSQGELFLTELENIIDPDHELAKLAKLIDWSGLEEHFGKQFSEQGRPGKPTRLMVGLHYLKYAFDLSDQEVLSRWLENPYWQYFCGRRYFEKSLPVESSSLTRWRKRFNQTDAEYLLKAIIDSAKACKALRPSDLKRVNVDTTTQEKNIRFPTDARSYNRMREVLVRQARKEGINLRQSYARIGEKLLRNQQCASRARNFKLSKACTRKLRTLLGRVIRDIWNKTGGNPSQSMMYLLEIGWQLHNQQRGDKGKIYSIHEPHVRCLSKGKPQKKYEFGNKASIVTTAKGNWILGAIGLDGAPFDGHTLEAALAQSAYLSGRLPDQAAVDRGYRGHGCSHLTEVLITDHRKKVPKKIRKWFKRRNAIEPVIGHLKQDHRMGRNYLKGVAGDRLNPILAACGFNFRKLMAFLWPEIFHYQWCWWRIRKGLRLGIGLA